MQQDGTEIDRVIIFPPTILHFRFGFLFFFFLYSYRYSSTQQRGWGMIIGTYTTKEEIIIKIILYTIIRVVVSETVQCT